MKIEKHVLEIRLLDRKSILGHLGEHLDLEVLHVLRLQHIKFVSHAHLDVRLPQSYILEVNFAGGIRLSLNELEVLSEPQADVLCEVIFQRPDEARLD